MRWTVLLRATGPQGKGTRPDRPSLLHRSHAQRDGGDDGHVLHQCQGDSQKGAGEPAGVLRGQLRRGAAMLKGLHHIAILASNRAETLAFYEALGFVVTENHVRPERKLFCQGEITLSDTQRNNLS